MGWRKSLCSFLYFWLGSICPSLWSAGAFTSPSTLIEPNAFKVPTVITRHCARRPYRPEYPDQSLPQKSWKIGDVKLAFVVLLVRYFCPCNDSCWNGESKINSVLGTWNLRQISIISLKDGWIHISLLYLHYPFGFVTWKFFLIM